MKEVEGKHQPSTGYKKFTFKDRRRSRQRQETDIKGGREPGVKKRNKMVKEIAATTNESTPTKNEKEIDRALKHRQMSTAAAAAAKDREKEGGEYNRLATKIKNKYLYNNARHTHAHKFCFVLPL